jgi:hypothetical protein
MAITINGTGSITGLTAGGLPDGSVTNADLEYTGTSGQVLTSQGSGSAPQWATLPASGINSVWTSLGSTTTTGATTFTVTGIPTNAKHIKIVIDGWSSSSSSGPQLGMRLGNGSIDTGNNYNWITSDYSTLEYGRDTDSIRLIRTGYNSEQNTFGGVIDIYKAGTNVICTWLLQAITYGVGSNHGGARWSGSSSIDRIQLLVPTGHNADAGYFSVFYETQP